MSIKPYIQEFLEVGLFKILFAEFSKEIISNNSLLNVKISRVFTSRQLDTFVPLELYSGNKLTFEFMRKYQTFDIGVDCD